MPAWVVPLITGVSGLIIGIIMPVVTRWLEFTLNRKQERWKHSLGLFTNVEEHAGFLLETVGGYPDYDREMEKIRYHLTQLANAAGAVSRYPAVVQAIRDFRQTAAYMTSRRGEFDSREKEEQVRRELHERHQHLMSAVDKALSQ